MSQLLQMPFAAQDGLDWWRWMGLFFIFASLFGCWLLVRSGRVTGRTFTSRIAKRLEVVESRPLGGRNHVSLVVVDGRSFLLAHGVSGTPAWQPLEPTAPKPPEPPPAT